MIANGIGVEGAKTMKELLKENSTLKSLNLGSEEERKEKEKERTTNDRQ